jgi:hypothetical protein
MPSLLRTDDATDISCAAEIFIATALLHREQPERRDFTIQEIVDRAARENISGKLRSGLNVHASQHCVANRAPNPAKHRMLFATGKHTRRLLLSGDDVHPERTGKIFPDENEIPARYLPLLNWARQRYESGNAEYVYQPNFEIPTGLATQQHEVPASERWLGSLFELEGLGKKYWKDVDPDEFVRKLREGWE